MLHLTYQPSRFNKFGNDTNGYNINSNNNDSSNINEVIRAVLNFLFFLQKDFAHTKSTKTQPSKNTKTQISEEK